MLNVNKNTYFRNFSIFILFFLIKTQGLKSWSHWNVTDGLTNCSYKFSKYFYSSTVSRYLLQSSAQQHTSAAPEMTDRSWKLVTMSFINLKKLVLCPTTWERKLTAIISAIGHSAAEQLTPGEIHFSFNWLCLHF